MGKRVRHARAMWAVPLLVGLLLAAGTACAPPKAEAVVVTALPLPPTAPATGTCTDPTGCIAAGRGAITGLRTFTWDGNHLLVGMQYAGAPAAPDPASIYTGSQLVLIKTDGTTFSNGDAWRCVTCGVPAENRVGANVAAVEYPEAFRDEKRVKFGTSILDCGPNKVIDEACTPASTHIYPIVAPFTGGFPAAGILRETRLHPDNVHLGWNQLFLSPVVTEFGAFGRLDFVPTPASGVPRYELSNVSFMYADHPDKVGAWFTATGPGQLRFDEPDEVIGEFRGFTNDGKAALGIGTQDSFNFDIFTTDLATGKSTRISRDPAYTDPATMSPDDKSIVIMDGRVDNRTGYPDGNPLGTDGRMYFASALPGVPPLLDMVVGGAVAGLYNNNAAGQEGRRFFEPYLINVKKDAWDNNRSVHDGQQLNGGGDTTPGNGGISDPLWNSGADPAWSPDGTRVAYYQWMVAPPFCDSPTPPEPNCPTSKEPGGRLSRLMIADLTSRTPTSPPPMPAPVADSIPWGTPYTAGDPLPPGNFVLPAGTSVLQGKKGSANVVITKPSPAETRIGVTYNGYSSDGVNIVNGTEEGISLTSGASVSYTWHSSVALSGQHHGTRQTSEPGGFVVTVAGLGQPAAISGSLTTVLDGLTFNSPVTGS